MNAKTSVFHGRKCRPDGVLRGEEPFGARCGDSMGPGGALARSEVGLGRAPK